MKPQEFEALARAKTPVAESAPEPIAESAPVPVLKPMDINAIDQQYHALLGESNLNEFAPGEGGSDFMGYIKALAHAWYTHDIRMLKDIIKKGGSPMKKIIDAQVAVEKMLNRGIHCPDGKVRKYYIDYDSEFLGVDIVSHDFYEHTDYGPDERGLKNVEIDDRTGKPWGPYEHMEFKGRDLGESVNEGWFDRTSDAENDAKVAGRRNFLKTVGTGLAGAGLAAAGLGASQNARAGNVPEIKMQDDRHGTVAYQGKNIPVTLNDTTRAMGTQAKAMLNGQPVNIYVGLDGARAWIPPREMPRMGESMMAGGMEAYAMEDEQLDGMALGELKAIAQAAKKIYTSVKQGVPLEAWMYKKITNGNEGLTAVAQQIDNPAVREQQGVVEMDSQQPQGRIKPDGTRSHSTYGSRDGHSITGPESTGKSTSPKKVIKKGTDILNRAFKDADKKGMTEGNVEKTTTGLKHTRDYEYPTKGREFNKDLDRLNKTQTGILDKALGVEWTPTNKRKEITGDQTGVAEGRKDAYQRDYDRSVAGMDAGPLGYEKEWDEEPVAPTYRVYVSDGTTWHREGGVYDHEMAAQRYIHQQVFTKNPQARVGIVGPGDAKPVVVPPIKGHTYKETVGEGWSQKYKNSINCSHPRGFSQKAHCAGKKKHTESHEVMEMTCPDCGMCETHGNLNEIRKGQKDSNGFTKCWPNKHAEGTKKGKNGGWVRKCVPNESVEQDPNDPQWSKKYNKDVGESTTKIPTGLKHHGDYGSKYPPEEYRDEYGHRVRGQKYVPGHEENEYDHRGRPPKAPMAKVELPADAFGRVSGKVPKGKQGIRISGKSNTDESTDYASAVNNLLNEFAGGMGAGSVASAPGKMQNPAKVGSLFGGSYSQKNSPFKKKTAKKESMIKRNGL